MRVVAGAARGRRLVAPRGLDVRPTTDRVKEALFSSLQPRLPDAAVLDLFAGAGGLGLEALSRGAATVTFVERARPALEALRRNLDAVGLPGGHVVTGDVHRALEGPLPGAPYDLVLADPPYELTDDELTTVLDVLVGHLAGHATVVIERAARDAAPRWPAELLPEEPRRYGGTALHRASRATPDADPSPSRRAP
ncbi:16S rRNA (guanine(966)-N(2))-methyltransferase RsmD [Egicoccus halophilus]|uniref:Methyltransferase n=1 Tax=Egicoccus halophilus TaxID=1670830 RepID=A0A8J3A8C8_9ACTN|nr:16S rRNA (guanine(966)-N(2))-methyltransferase RsmD [Egicoccus halophilus]GGI06446.1 methyltransferase [Egicoccus halophilus]